MNLNIPEQYIKNNIDSDAVLKSYLHKLNYTMIISSKLCNNLTLIGYNFGKNHDFCIQESLLINNLYNKNLFDKINNYIKINNYDIVKISNAYMTNQEVSENIGQPEISSHASKLQQYIKDSIWQNLKNINLTDIINDDTIDIRIRTLDNEYNFDQTIDRQQIRLVLESYAKEIVIKLNEQFHWIDHNIDEYFSTGIVRDTDFLGENIMPISEHYVVPPPPIVPLHYPVPPPIVLIPGLDTLPQTLKNTILQITNDNIVRLIEEYKLHPNFVEPQKQKFITKTKNEVLNLIKQKLEKNEPEFYKLNDKTEEEAKKSILEYLLHLISNTSYKCQSAPLLLNTLNENDIFNLQTKLLIIDTDLHEKVKMIIKHINENFNTIYNKIPKKDIKYYPKDNEKELQKLFKKYKLIKEIIVKKYSHHLIFYKSDKEIKSAVETDLKKSIKQFSDSKYIEFTVKDIFDLISKYILNEYPYDFLKIFGDTQKLNLKAYLNKIKQETVNQYGGYNSINYALDRIDYKIVRDRTLKNILTYMIIDEEGTYVNDAGVEVRYKLPYRAQIYYTIRKNDGTNKKIVLMNLYYERKDTIKRLPTYMDYFFIYNNTFENLLTINYATNHDFTNVIGINSLLDNLRSVIKQKYDTKRKKKLVQLIFILNLFNNNCHLFNKNILENLTIDPLLLRSLNTILRELNHFFINYDNTNEFCRYLRGFYFDLITNFDNHTETINIHNINLGITNPNTLYTNFVMITQAQINDYLYHYNNIENKNKIKGLEKITKMMVFNQSDTTFIFDNSIYRQFYIYNKKILGVNDDGTYTDNSINKKHIDYLCDKAPLFDSTYKYTQNNYQFYNNLLYTIYTANDIKAEQLFNQTKILNQDYKNHLNHTLNIYQAIMNCNNSDNEPGYLVLRSKQYMIFGLNDKSIISDYSIGDEFIIPRFLSTTIDPTQDTGIFKDRVYGYNFMIIVPTNEKFLTLFGNCPGSGSNLSNYPGEKEILLPPGYYKILNVEHLYGEQYEIVLLFESMKIDDIEPENNLINRTYTPQPAYSENLKYLKAIRTKLKKRKTDMHLKNLPQPMQLKLLDFDSEIKPYIIPLLSKNPTILQFNSLSELRNINTHNLDKYLLSNLSPFYNIFTIQKDDYYDNVGKKRFNCFQIDYKTLLYTGQFHDPVTFVNNKKIYLSNFMIAVSYGIAQQYQVKNNYTILLDGTRTPIRLLDNFHPENVRIIKEYYDSSTCNPDHKQALSIYYKFNSNAAGRNCTNETQFVWNNEPQRIKYNTLYYSNLEEDYSKFSASTENDAIVIEVYKHLFGDHDGYISRAQFGLCHFNGVFDDEIAIYDFQEMSRKNQIQLILDIPTTIISSSHVSNNILGYLDNPVLDHQKYNLYVAEYMFTIRKILEKTKLNRLYESLKYSFMFDKYVDSLNHPYEKYFKNIYDLLNSKGYLSLLNIPPVHLPVLPSFLPLLGGKNNLYKQKYLKYKKKYLDLKNN